MNNIFKCLNARVALLSLGFFSAVVHPCAQGKAFERVCVSVVVAVDGPASDVTSEDEFDDVFAGFAKGADDEEATSPAVAGRRAIGKDVYRGARVLPPKHNKYSEAIMNPGQGWVIDPDRVRVGTGARVVASAAPSRVVGSSSLNVLGLEAAAQTSEVKLDAPVSALAVVDSPHQTVADAHPDLGLVLASMPREPVSVIDASTATQPEDRTCCQRFCAFFGRA